MTKEEIDTMWQQAMQESIKDGEMFTRYHFAEMVTEAERERIKQANAPEIEKINAHIQKAMTALEEVLAEHAMREVQRLGQEIEQEPVELPCCGYTDASAVKWNPFNGVVQCHNCGQCYTTPPQRKWLGLSPNELNMISDSMKTWNSFQITDVYFAIEAKLKEKNT